MTNISESFYLQDGGKNQQMEMEQNYVTVTPCMTTKPMTTRRCSLLGFLPARRIRGFFINDMRYINPRFTYLLTYLLMLARVYIAMALCLSVCLSVCHKSVFYRNGWTDRAGFWHVGFFQPMLHCVMK